MIPYSLTCKITEVLKENNIFYTPVKNITECSATEVMLRWIAKGYQASIRRHCESDGYSRTYPEYLFISKDIDLIDKTHEPWYDHGMFDFNVNKWINGKPDPIRIHSYTPISSIS